MSVRWGCSISKEINVTNGIRQGGVLSPNLFNVYIDGLSNILNNCTTGGFLGGKRINNNNNNIYLKSSIQTSSIEC